MHGWPIDGNLAFTRVCLEATEAAGSSESTGGQPPPGRTAIKTITPSHRLDEAPSCSSSGAQAQQSSPVEISTSVCTWIHVWPSTTHVGGGGRRPAPRPQAAPGHTERHGNSHRDLVARCKALTQTPLPQPFSFGFFSSGLRWLILDQAPGTPAPAAHTHAHTDTDTERHTQRRRYAETQTAVAGFLRLSTDYGGYCWAQITSDPGSLAPWARLGSLAV